MAVDQFCLKWNNFQASIITAFESLQSTEDLADVTLTCEGLNVKAHKIILSACSTYFRTVFKENPCPHPIVILKDILYVDLLAILNFMYHGEVLVMKDQLQSFLQTAEVLQVSGLIGCTNFPIKNVLGPIKPFKPQKTASTKLQESVEPAAKKAKVAASPKAKNKVVSSPSTSGSNENSGLSPRDHMQKIQSPTPERFEVVNVDKIKVEVEDDNNELGDGCEREGHGKGNEQSSLLEAALELKDSQPSILERSLTFLSTASKSPSAPLYSLEPIVSLQQTCIDLPKNLFIPRKPPDQSDNEPILKQKLTEFNVPSTLEISPEKSSKSIESMEGLQGGGSEVLLMQDMQPHHSSQCGNCPHCGKIYSNQSALKYHVRLVHSDLTNMYCCHLCPESFDYREGYKKHMVEAHNVRN